MNETLNKKMEEKQIHSVTCTAPVNIAVIKYWGKRDEKLILPTNSSISGTLDQTQMCAKTTVAASKSFTCDKMWLNGEEQDVNTKRLQNVFCEVRRRARKRKMDGKVNFLGQHVHICSENNFPTAAGLASSAAGLACLVYSMAKLFGVDGDISDIARQGSGSACRSVYGGFVKWTMGTAEDGSDSIASQVVPESHWPEMKVLILVVSAKKKHIGSTAGMQTSVKTSGLMQHRVEKEVPLRMNMMTSAILNKDFELFAEITMKDSNQMHAVCLDTYPPISYMTDTSRDIQRLVHAINDHYGHNKVAYTFDAGPNACLYLLEDNVPMVLSLIKHFFPPTDNGNEFVQGIKCNDNIPTVDQAVMDSVTLHPNPGVIQYIISTQIGSGPQAITDPKESLLTEKGFPRIMDS